MHSDCTNCKYLKEYNKEKDYCICDRNYYQVPSDFVCDFYVQKKPSGAMRRKRKKHNLKKVKMFDDACYIICVGLDLVDDFCLLKSTVN